MALQKITSVVGRGVPVPGDDIDTDRIIPARYMKCVTFDGLGERLFYDVRYDDDGKALNHPLDNPNFKDATILISGRNFGCGSSREHAPQAISKFGLKAVIAESFAEIFFGNSTTLGLPCVCLSTDDLQTLSAAVEADSSIEITIDIEANQVRFGDHTVSSTIPDGARKALLAGEYDALSLLLDQKDKVKQVAENLPYSAW